MYDPVPDYSYHTVSKLSRTVLVELVYEVPIYTGVSSTTWDQWDQ